MRDGSATSERLSLAPALSRRERKNYRQVICHDKHYRGSGV